jgi:photosystem II stability/assembly factor-like uncharacterized protein
VARPATKERFARPRHRPAAKRRPEQRRHQRSPWLQSPRGAALLIAAALVVVGVVALIATREATPARTSTSVPVVGPDLHSLVVDPTERGRLWIGSHRGASVSTDGGQTWRVEPSLDDADAMGWAFQRDTILVGGHPGISVSTDGGQTFEARNEGLPATDVHALGAGESVIYAASPAAGVFASTDGGSTWEMRTEEVGQGFMGAILVDPADEDHLIAPDMQAGVAESTDGGRSWSALGGVQGAMWVTWDPKDTDHIIVTTHGAAAETTDGGKTWDRLEIPTGASLVEMDSRNPARLYAAVHQDPDAIVWLTRDGGSRWVKP